MADVEQMGNIYDWMGEPDQYRNGVTNDQVIEKFGDDHKDSWKLLKQRGKRQGSFYFEDGKWFRWHKPRHSN